VPTGWGKTVRADQRKDAEMNVLSFLRGVGVGAGLMYFCDPNRGRYRRSLVRDQLVSLAHDMDRFWDAACCDLQNRFEGAVAEAGHLVGGEPVSDDVLARRVRSQMGRCITHPHNIAVEADRGRVTLRGPILSREAEGLIRCVRMVRGVTGVRNELELHEQAGDLPALQGSGQPMQSAGLCTGNWSPGTRLVAGTLGAGFFLRGLMQSFPLSCVSGTIGLALMARAYTSGAAAPGRNRRRRRGQSSRSAGSATQTTSSHAPEGPAVAL
jgi:osmotically-inducible protein OsmY